MPLAAAFCSAFFSDFSTALAAVTLAPASAAAGPLVSPGVSVEEEAGVPIDRTFVLGAEAEVEVPSPPIESTLALG